MKMGPVPWPPSVEGRAPLVDALRAICELDLSKLDSVEPPAVSDTTEIYPNNTALVESIFSVVLKVLFLNRAGCHEYNLPSFSEGEFLS